MTNTETSRGQAGGVLLVLVTLFSWSSVLLFLRHLSPHIDAWTANGWRYGLCAAGLLPFLLVRQLNGKAEWSLWRRAVVPTFFNSIGQTLFGFAVYYIEPGLAGFLLRVSLISSTLGAFLLFADERVLLRSRLFWTGLVLIIAGSICTVVLGHQPLRGNSIIGVIIAASAGAFFGCYGVSVRYCMRGVRPIDSFAAIATLTAAIMIAMMLWQSPTRGAAALDLSTRNFLLMVLSAIIGIAIGHIFYYAAIARLGVATAAAIVQLAPFICGAGSVVLFGEVLTAGQWLAGLGMLAGGSLLLRAERLRPSPAKPPFPVEIEACGDPVVAAVGDERDRAQIASECKIRAAQSEPRP